MGGSSGGGGTTTTTQNTAPWAAQQPFLERGFAEALNNYQYARPSYFPGSTVAQPGGTTQAAWNTLYGTAAGGVPTTGSTLGMLQRTANGGFVNPGSATFSGFASGSNFPSLVLGETASGSSLNGNPFLDATADAATRKIVDTYKTAVAPGVDANFVAGGRYGSGQHAMMKGQADAALGTALSDAVTGIYAGNYQAERDRQLGAAGTLGQSMLGGAQGISQNAQDERMNQMRGAALVPALEQARFLPGQIMAGVGAEQDMLAQANLNDSISRWNFQQQLPNNLLAQYMGLVQGNYGGTGTMTQPYTSNRGANILGGALGGGALGYGLAPLMGFGGPAGMAVGAGLGGLLGLF
jgi:hypothetical protein